MWNRVQLTKQQISGCGQLVTLNGFDLIKGDIYDRPRYAVHVSMLDELREIVAVV